MPLEWQTLNGREWDPPMESVREQFENIVLETRLKGWKKPRLLLEYLLKKKYGERYLEPFNAAKPFPTGAKILNEFYEYRRKEYQENIPRGGPVTAGRALLAKIREALNDFYSSDPEPSSIRNIQITVGDGFQDAYEPKVCWITETTQSEEPIVSGSRMRDLSEVSFNGHQYAAPMPSLDPGLADFYGRTSNPYRMNPIVDCHFLGNEEEATQYIADRIHTSLNSSNPITGFNFLDTRPLNPDDPYRDTNTLEWSMHELVSAFLRNPEPRIQVYVSGSTDRNILWAFGAVLSELDQEAVERTVICYSLDDDVLPIKLVSMKYDDGTGELLFGWGHMGSESNQVFDRVISVYAAHSLACSSVSPRALGIFQSQSP